MDPKLLELMGRFLDTCTVGDIFGVSDFMEYVKKVMPKKTPTSGQVGRLCTSTGRCRHAEWTGYYEVIE